MTPQQLSRLERLEKFVERLTLGSYIAKAAGEGGRVIGNHQTLEPAEQDLANTVTDGNDPLATLSRRVKQLEALVRDLMAPTGKPTGTPIMQGETTLAKAVQAFNDADSLLSYADGLTDDATTMGIISGHLAAGDMRAAKTAVLELADRQTVAKAAGDMGAVVGAGVGLETDMGSYDAKATASELTARFAKMEQLLASLETRLSQLEARPQVAASVDNGQMVAKASGSRKRTKEEIETRLYADLDAYVDSPTTTGQISSMIAAGQYKQVQQVLANAKRAHESARIASERKRF